MFRFINNLFSASLKSTFIRRGIRVGAPFVPLYCAYSTMTFWASFEESQEKALYLWGNNENRLAACDLEESVIKFPTRMPFFDDKNLVCISMAGDHAAAIDDRGNLYQWGSAFTGSKDPADPVCTLAGVNISHLCCSQQGVVIGTKNGSKLYVIPIVGDHGYSDLKTSFGNPLHPVNIESLSGSRIAKITCGNDHLMILDEGGGVHSVALTQNGNVYGQLGIGATAETKSIADFDIEEPEGFDDEGTMMGIIPKIKVKPSASEKHKENLAELYCRFTSKKIGSKIKDVACGENHTLLLSKDGNVFSFGSNEWLQLALGTFSRDRAVVATPTPIHSLWLGGTKSEDTNVSRIAAGSNTSYFAVDSPEETNVYSAGAGIFGQLGNGGWNHLHGTPVKIVRISGLTYYCEKDNRVMPIRCKYLTAGDTHAAAVMSTNRPPTYHDEELPYRHGDDVYIWGGNKYFQLGIGGRHHNLAHPSTIIPFPLRPSSLDSTGAISEKLENVKNVFSKPKYETGLIGTVNLKGTLAERVLKLTGPLIMNKERTMSFAGGQFQLLTDPSTKDALQKIYCGPGVTAIY